MKDYFKNLTFVLVGLLLSLLLQSAAKKKSYDDYCIEAAHYVDESNPKLAVTLASKGIKLAPKRVGCYRQRAYAYMEDKQYKLAEADLNRVVKLEPGHSYGWAELGYCHIYLKSPLKAYSCMEHACALDPYSESAMTNFLKLARQMKREKKARDRIAVVRGKNYSSLTRGIAYETSDQPEKAIREYDKYIANHPDDIMALEYRGNCYRALKQADKALKDFNRLRQIDPGMRHVYYLIAKVREIEGKFDLAIKNCSTVLRIYKRHEDARRLRANLYIRKKQYKNAISDLTYLIGLKKWNIEVDYRVRGDCYFALKQYQKAIDDYTNSIEMNLVGGNKSSYLARAKAWEKLGQLKKAKADRLRANR